MRVETKHRWRDNYQQISEQQDCNAAKVILVIVILIIIKLEVKENISKAEKKDIIFKKATIRLAADFSTETMESRGKTKVYFERMAR